MSTSRLLFAINHKDTEDKIAAQVRSKCLCVGAVTYREAVLPAIVDNHVDIVLIRDTLGGSLKIEDLVRQIRMECPKTRIIFLSSQRPKNDPLLSTLVSYGIYDIIVSDAVQLQTIVSYIVSPRTFRDVAVYFRPLSVEDIQEDEPEEKPNHGGGLFGLFGRNNKPSEPQIVDSTPKSHDINLDALRASIEEEANRKAQQGIQAVIKQAVEQETKALRQELKEKESALESASASLKTQARTQASASHDVEALRNQIEAMEKEHAKEKDRLNTVVAEYEQRLLATKSTQDPEWFLQRSQEWERERDELQSELERMKRDTEQLRQNAQAGLDMPRVDFSLEDGGFILPDVPDITPANPSENHVFLFMGAKHGVGNTTAALNTATMLASGGQKTLLIEMNSHFPLLNNYFEFTNLTTGVDTACKGLKESNFRAVEAAIIKPHALTPANRSLGKAYKKLPGSLHFMTFSNNYLLGTDKLETSYFKDLIYALLMQSKYSYIIIDIQTDEPELMALCESGSIMADKLVITLSQDPHAIASTGYLVTTLAKGGCAKLLRNAVFLVNQYLSNVDPKLGKVAKYLSTNSKQCFAISRVNEGYIKAAMSAVPYVYNGGQTGEYQAIAEAIRH